MKTAYDMFKEAFDREPNPPALDVTTDELVAKLKTLSEEDFKTAHITLGQMLGEDGPVGILAMLAMHGMDTIMITLAKHFVEQPK